MKIQRAKPEDAAAISSLIFETAATQLRNEFSDQGWQLFLELISQQTQESLINNKKFNHLLAMVEGEAEGDNPGQMTLAGILVIKDKNHLFHFFVKPQWQGRGIGKRLWYTYIEEYKALNSDKLFRQSFDLVTVNSSDFALQFYQQLGFAMNGERQKKKGVCYTPMTFIVPH